MLTITASLLFLAFDQSHAEALYDIPIKDLNDGNTYYLKVDYCTVDNEAFTMNARCYCFSENGEEDSYECSIPGPTLRMFSGTTINVILVNGFNNSLRDEPDCFDRWCDMDVTNLHTHGLHVSSAQDEVLNNVYPGETYNYTYTIPEDHYPGIHWYHPHNHGSVSHQVHMGLFGGLITEYSPTLNEYEASDKKLCDNKMAQEEEEETYIRHILVFSHVYAVDNDVCECLEPEQRDEMLEYPEYPDEGVYVYGRCKEHGKDCFFIYSSCYEYCAFDAHDTSGFKYDVSIKDPDTNIAQYFLVNGQLNPTIENVNAGYFRRLRLINVIAQYFIQYDFPDECEFYNLGHDGIYFDSGPRNLSKYGNQLLLSPGSRADILFKCDIPGTYQINTTQSTEWSSSLGRLERAGMLGDTIDSIGNAEPVVLFTIQVVDEGGLDVVTELPDNFPSKPEYLKDLSVENEYDNYCACNGYQSDVGCYISYSSKDEMYLVNNLQFESENFYMTYMLQDRIYQFVLKADRHVHHQHIYPFQIQSTVPEESGFIAQPGDWYDTFGAPPSDPSPRMRTYTADFSGYQIFHCHLLSHEDQGMMAIHMVIKEDELYGPDNEFEDDLNERECLDDLLKGNHTVWIEPAKGGGSKNSNSYAIAPQISDKIEEKIIYKGLGGISYTENDGGLLSNHMSLIILTALSLLMLFNTIMILKFQFCGIPHRGQGLLNYDDNKKEEEEEEEDESDSTSISDNDNDNDNDNDV